MMLIPHHRTMISSWLTQITTCWSFVCSPASPLSTRNETSQSNGQSCIGSVSGNEKKVWSKSYGVEKVLSTITSSTAISSFSLTGIFSSINKTRNCSINRIDEEAQTMVVRQPESHGQTPNHLDKVRRKGVAPEGTGSSSFASLSYKQGEKKSELLYPVSPYDEIPVIRDLFEHLSPFTESVHRRRDAENEPLQEREDVASRHRENRKVKNRIGLLRIPRRECNYLTRDRNDPNEVPFVIEMPTTPTYSDDSELSLDEGIRQYEEDQRDQHSLTLHLSYEDDLDKYQRMARNIHNLDQASEKSELESGWPSDEEKSPHQKKTNVNKKYRKGTQKARARHQLILV